MQAEPCPKLTWPNSRCRRAVAPPMLPCCAARYAVGALHCHSNNRHTVWIVFKIRYCFRFHKPVCCHFTSLILAASYSEPWSSDVTSGTMGIRYTANICNPDFTLQSLTGKYREIQGNPCNENRDPAMKTGFPCNESRFFPVGIDLQGVRSSL